MSIVVHDNYACGNAQVRKRLIQQVNAELEVETVLTAKKTL